MTYWPISSPSVFAATKTTVHESLPTSHDGAHPDHRVPPSRHGGARTDTSGDDSEWQSERDDESTDDKHEVEEETAEKQVAVEEDQPEDDVSGEIIAIQVTRSGQMFATITRSTLTIWQTKASNSSAVQTSIADH